jgi:hypothetical protein
MPKKDTVEDMFYDEEPTQEVTNLDTGKRARGRPRKDAMPAKDKRKEEILAELAKEEEREEKKHAKKVAEIEATQEGQRKESHMVSMQDTYRDRIEKLERLLEAQSGEGTQSKTKLDLLEKKLAEYEAKHAEIQLKLDQARMQERQHYNTQLQNIKKGIRY